jgi:hypothetical protein
MSKFVSGTRPYSEEERKRDRAAKQDADARQYARRKVRRSRQNYDKPMSADHRRTYDRMVGSE